MSRDAAEFVLPFTEMTLSGRRLRAARFPNGIVDPSRAVLCIPGYAAAGESFARLRPLTAAYDLRLLTLPDDGWRYDDPIGHFGGLVAEFARRLNHPVLLGTSFGGLVAIDVARRLGAQISGVVLISTFARVSAGRRFLLAAGRGLMQFAATHFQGVGIRFLGGVEIDKAAALELRRETEAIGVREKHARLSAAVHVDAREAVSKIAAPILIIHGADDHLVPAAAARELRALAQHGQLVEIAGAGHLPYLTHAEETNAALSRFFSTAFEVEHRALAGVR